MYPFYLFFCCFFWGGFVFLLFFFHCTLRTTVCVCIQFEIFKIYDFFLLHNKSIGMSNFPSSETFRTNMGRKGQIEWIDGGLFPLIANPDKSQPFMKRTSKVLQVLFQEGKKKGREWVFTNAAASICHYYWPQGKSLEGVWNTNCRYSQRAKTPHTHHYFHNDFLCIFSPLLSCKKKVEFALYSYSYKSEGLNLREKVHHLFFGT